MELWIRSQDRMKLVNNCNLYISSEIRNEYIIEDLNNKYLNLGTYKTKERALKVLDEIQEIIKWCQKDMKDVTIGDMENLKGCFYDCVYEMPKE